MINYKSGLYTIIAIGALTLPSCRSYDVMDSWNRLEKKENRQEQRIQYEIDKLKGIETKKQTFINALEKILKKVKNPETAPELGPEKPEEEPQNE